MKAAVQEQITPFYGFGPFLVDTGKCALLRNGEVIPLSMKAFEILLLLIQYRGQVVEKDEILKRVWPNTVVEENNLARNISTLRKALDEHPNEHQYILTVPGRGYRFVASVRELEQASETLDAPVAVRSNVRVTGDLPAVNSPQEEAILETPADDELASTFKRRPQSLVLILAILVAGITALALWIFLTRPSSQAGQTPARKLWQLTFDSGLESEPTWSPDGRLIAYSADRDGNFDIWVQPAGEGNPVRVTNSPAHDWQPDWAPEGNRLVFRSERDGGGLYVVPVLGGNERKVSSFGYRPRWSPDGSRILFYSSILRNNTVELPKVYVMESDGKTPNEVLNGFLTEFNSVRVAWHPDGQRLSVWGNHRQQGWSFWTAPLIGGAPVKSEFSPQVSKQLKEADVTLTDFQWSPGCGTLFFEGVSQSVRNIWKVEIEPNSLRWIAGPERLTTGAGRDTDLALSSNGKRLAFTVRSEHTRLWSLPFDAAAGRVKGAGQPITNAGIDASYPDLSPSGERLVFRAQQAGKEEVREKSLKDGRETVLVSDDLSRQRMIWSPDGSRFVYTLLRPTNSERTRIERSLALMSVKGGDEQMLTTPDMVSYVPWDWSADGKWILGGTDGLPPGRRLIGLFPIAAAPHAETQMRVVASHPEKNIYQAHFSPDNQWISFNAAKAFGAGISTIYVVPASGGEWRQITEGRYFDDKPRWSPDGRKLYFISNRTGFFNVWGVGFDPATGATVGEPFRVTAFENPGQMILTDVRILEMSLASNRLILPIMEVSGGIWVLENVER
jgi:Tol biopolymer transport system component/DNA-binding winged helix-turn-helix (wHTH) protein